MNRVAGEASESGLRVNEFLVIPESELAFHADRSGGPGGQHVNKVSTRVTVSFDVAASPSLTEDQRGRIRIRLQGRINQAGVLRVSSRKFRSQFANREAARFRMAELLAIALEDQVERRPTRPTVASRLRRLERKSRDGRRKAQRAKPGIEEGER